MTAHRVVSTRHIELDYLEAVQLIAAAEAREEHFRRLIERTGDPDLGLGKALIYLITAELGIRQAFEITRDDLPDIPLADDRHPALATYQDEGR